MTEKPERKKRSKRTPQECPFCHKLFGNLKNHIAMKHQAEDQEQPVELTREDLFKKKPPPEKPGKKLYHCTSCEAEVKKDESPCWNCGRPLLWDGIE